MLAGTHTWAMSRYAQYLKSLTIQRDGLFCCKKHGCGKLCKFEDLHLDKLGSFHNPRNLHLLCKDCWSKKMLTPLQPTRKSGDPPAH